VCLARLNKTRRKGQAAYQFVVLRGVVLKSPAITGEVQEQELTETPSVREPHYQPKRASSRPVRHLRCVVLERPNGSASPGTAIVQDLKRQRPRYIDIDIADIRITIAAENLLRSPETSSNRVRRGWNVRLR